ncbi:MAG: recombinase family protein [Hyphomicrobiaceae bacterium]|nr:MAG: recombinase family protein [Hyphomicrobiaceae bacterium]
MARRMNKRVTAEQLALGEKVERTALYIRVSTERQATEGFSLDAQKQRLLDYCSAHQWHVGDDHIYVDAGISGKTTNRPAFQAMLQAAQDGEIRRVVAVKLDRVARNTKDFLATVETLQAYGCSLALIQEGFDTSTPQGKFAITMFAAMAELEASMIGERVSSGRKQKASEGGYNGAQCPLGYQYTNGSFTVDSGAAHWVREVFTRFTAGQGMSKIADDLNAAGAMTARGGKWYAGTVRYLLLNGFYAGLSQWDGVEQPGNHPAIISRELYEQAHQRLQAIKPGPEARI